MNIVEIYNQYNNRMMYRSSEEDMFQYLVDSRISSEGRHQVEPGVYGTILRTRLEFVIPGSLADKVIKIRRYFSSQENQTIEIPIGNSINYRLVTFMNIRDINITTNFWYVDNTIRLTVIFNSEEISGGI